MLQRPSTQTRAQVVHRAMTGEPEKLALREWHALASQYRCVRLQRAVHSTTALARGGVDESSWRGVRARRRRGLPWHEPPAMRHAGCLLLTEGIKRSSF